MDRPLLLVIVDVELPVAEIIITICLSDLPYRTAGITVCEHVVGNILRYYASAADYDVVADRNAGTYDYITADPDVLTDRDIDSVLITGVT